MVYVCWHFHFVCGVHTLCYDTILKCMCACFSLFPTVFCLMYFRKHFNTQTRGLQMKNTHVLSGVLLICSVLDWINQTQRRGITLCSVWCDLWSVTHALCVLGVSKRSSVFSCVWCWATFSPDLKAASLISSFCSICGTSPVIRGIWFARVVMDFDECSLTNAPVAVSVYFWTSMWKSS